MIRPCPTSSFIWRSANLFPRSVYTPALSLASISESVRQVLTAGRDRRLRPLASDEALLALLPDAPPHHDVAAVLPRRGDVWPITPDMGRLLARLVMHGGRRRVLEFGAGSSSLVLARALALAGGGRLTSLEQHPEWCAEQWRSVLAHDAVDAELEPVHPRLTVGRAGLAHVFTDARAAVSRRGPYDLVFVDAPQWYYGRDGALPLVLRHLAPGAWIVMDDAERSNERWTVSRWLDACPTLRLVVFDPDFGERGVAILRSEAASAWLRARPYPLLTSAYQALTLWWERRRLQDFREAPS